MLLQGMKDTVFDIFLYCHRASEWRMLGLERRL